MHRPVFAAMLSVVLLLAGCQETAPQRRIPMPEPTKPVTLKIGVYGTAFQPMLDPLISAFQAEHPNYRVEKVDAGFGETDAWKRMQTLAAEGQVDVVPLSMDPPMRDHLRPLDGWAAKSQLDLKPFGKLLDEAYWNGRLLELPISFLPSLLVYNTEMASAAGAAIPAGNWTWDEFREAARKLTVTGGQTPVWGIAATLPQWLPRAWIEGKTGQPAWLSDPTTIDAALQFFATMVHTDKSHSPVTPGVFTEATSQYRYEFDALKALNERQAAMGTMLAYPPVLSREMAIPWALAPIPSHAGMRAVTPGATYSLGISAKSGQPDEAWEFIKFAAGPEGAAILANAGYMPAYRTDAVEAAWNARQGGRIPGNEAIWNSVWHAAQPYRVGGPSTDAFNRAVNQTLSGLKSRQEAMAEFLKRSTLKNH